VSAAESLLADLDAAPGADERAALLANAHDPVLLGEVATALSYRRMNAEIRAELAVEAAQHEAFTAALAACADDSARMEVIAATRADSARGDAFVNAWVWERQATADDLMARYMAMLRAPRSAVA
jgi:hypothetical protein